MLKFVYKKRLLPQLNQSSYFPHHSGKTSGQSDHLLPPRCALSICSRQVSTSHTMLEKEGLIGRFKQMVKDYWYIIIPVDLGTSAIWYGAIFLTLKSGVDLVEVLSSLGVSEKTLEKLPSAGVDNGYHALTLLCYNVITPIRLTVSIAVSAALVSRLNKTQPGYLKTSSRIAKHIRSGWWRR